MSDWVDPAPPERATRECTFPTEAPRPLRVLLVDPSLFTAPYDGALNAGLVEAGVLPRWAVRPTRPGDAREIADEYVDAFFYRHVDRLRFLPQRALSALKGVAHAKGLITLLLRVARFRPDVVHFQWAVVPLLDALCFKLIRRYCPVVLTVHDTVPFNGDNLSFLQQAGFDLPLRCADQVVVHTRSGREALLARGVPPHKIQVIAHGPLAMRVSVPTRSDEQASPRRVNFILFGELKPYKGIDLLVEAVGLLPPAIRAQCRVIIAGRPRMKLDPVKRRIVEAKLDDTVELWPRRLSEQEMARLFADTDCFVFPYRQIDASGVYYLTRPLDRWLIATRAGIFAEEIADGVQGNLVPVNDVRALAGAIENVVIKRPIPTRQPGSSPPSWAAIGARTRGVYCALLEQRKQLRKRTDEPSALRA